MNGIKEFFKGKKTYIVAILLVAVAIVQWLSGDMTLIEFINSEAVLTLLSAFGLSSLRAAIAKGN